MSTSPTEKFREDLIVLLRTVGYVIVVRDVVAALQLLTTTVFTSATGSRTTAPNWVMVIMDGQSQNPSNTASQAVATRSASEIDKMFAVGVTNAVSYTELASLASSTSYVYQFNYTDMISGFAVQFVCTNLVRAGS
jgi:von Willebrand factor type A domain